LAHKIKKTLKWALECIDYKDGDEILIERSGRVLALRGELPSLCILIKLMSGFVE